MSEDSKVEEMRVGRTVEFCCDNSAAMLELADNGERDNDKRKRLQTANHGQAELLRKAGEMARETIAALVAERDALKVVVDGFMQCMKRFGDMDEGCFYYNGRSADELKLPMEKAAALKVQP